VSLTFVVGKASDVFGADLARAIDVELSPRFPSKRGGEAYRSEPVDVMGWRALQTRVLRALDVAPQITSVDAYQAVYAPSSPGGVEHLPIANLADPLQVGSLPALIAELERFALTSMLPTDDVELMKLSAYYLEHEDPNADLDVQTYVQLLLSAKQAVARGEPLWIVL